MEQFVWRQLQETFSVVMKSLLEGMDEQIAQDVTRNATAFARNARLPLLAFLNSAVGSLEMEEQEQRLFQLICQLEKYPEALGNYRKWLEEQGIETTGMRLMGSAEGTVSVFAKSLKNGRSWGERGVSAMITGLIAFLDQLTLFGRMEKWSVTAEEKKLPEHFAEKMTSTNGEVTRNNLLYLNGKANLPIYKALKALTGF